MSALPCRYSKAVLSIKYFTINQSLLKTKLIKMGKFKSVDPVCKNLQRNDGAINCIDILEKNEKCIIIILDGEDIGSTQEICNNAKWKTEYQKNLFYFQKRQQTYYKQKENLENLDAFEQKGWIMSQIRNFDIRTHIHVCTDLPIPFAILDSCSYPLECLSMFTELLRHKKKKDYTPIFVHLVDIVKTSETKIKMLSSKPENSKLVELLKNNKTRPNQRILKSGKTEIENVLKRIGYQLASLENYYISPEFKSNYINDNQDNFFTFLYGENVNDINSDTIVMRMRIFALEPIPVINEELSLPEVDTVVYQDEEDLETEMQQADVDYIDQILKHVKKKISKDFKNKDILSSLENYDEYDTIAHLVNILLPKKDKRKKYHKCLIHAQERAGKTGWLWVMQIIQKCHHFQEYVDLENDDKNISLHVVCGPYVTVPVNDFIQKSKDFSSLLKKDNFKFLKKTPSKRQLQDARFLLENYDTNFISGSSEAGMINSENLITCRGKDSTETLLFIDEADLFFSEASSKIKMEKILRNMLKSQHICGSVFVTASILPLFMETQKLFDNKNEKNIIFKMKTPEDYKGIDSFKNKWPLYGHEKLHIENITSMHECVSDYLANAPNDKSLINQETKQRAIGLCVVMATLRVNTDDGLKLQAKNLSAGRFKHVEIKYQLPICICINALGYDIFENGINIVESFNFNKGLNLQSILPLILKRYQYNRHIVIFAYNMMNRGITTQFNSNFEHDEEQWKILGFVSHIVFNTKVDKHFTFNRSNESITQQFLRFAMRRQNFDIPFFNDFVIKGSCIYNLESQIIQHKENENRVIDCFIKAEGDIDETWKIFEQDSLTEKVITNPEFTKISKRKINVDDYMKENHNINTCSVSCNTNSSKKRKSTDPNEANHFKAVTYILHQFIAEGGLSSKEILEKIKIKGLLQEYTDRSRHQEPKSKWAFLVFATNENKDEKYASRIVRSLQENKSLKKGIIKIGNKYTINADLQAIISRELHQAFLDEII